MPFDGTETAELWLRKLGNRLKIMSDFNQAKESGDKFAVCLDGNRRTLAEETGQPPKNYSMSDFVQAKERGDQFAV